MPNDNYANEPNQSRSEEIIQSILDNTEYDEEARSRIEYLLIELKNAIEGGGGGGGVTSYAPLTEKPKIDNHTLQAGNNTSSDLGLQTKLAFDSAPTESSTNPVTSGGVYTALAAKANSTDVYNKSAIDTALNTKADKSTTYAKSEVDTALNTKADKSTTYAKSEVDTALSAKQDTISDLTTIRSGAALGATAVQPISGKGLSTNDYTNDEKTKLAGIAEGAEVNVQSNWTQSSPTADDYIKNKPTLGTASALDVAASGNASTSQVVKGNDTRLTDARNAADVSSWAKKANKPSYNGSEIALSGYAEAQSKSSVAATDTVNTAIGKLEYRVKTNENNILTDEAALVKLVDGVAKNCLPIPSSFSGELANEATIATDGTITITLDAAMESESSVQWDFQLSAGTFHFSCGENSSMDGAYDCYIRTITSPTTVLRDNSSSPGQVATIASGDYRCYIRMRANAPAGTYVFKPMLCTKAAWDISQTYQPYRPSYQELYERVVALEQASL